VATPAQLAPGIADPRWLSGYGVVLECSGLFGSLPFALTESLNVGVADAIFESISGLTTTGATVLTGLDDLPQSILLYRQLLQWLGGIGIIVVAVAVLPMLGIGGMQLYRAETPGPSKDSKLTPRITETAKLLFSVYLALTVLCALAYAAAGMSGFDAVCHAFSTVAIGGFSTHDASMGYFDSNPIYLISAFFMLISALNIGLHYAAFTAAPWQATRGLGGAVFCRRHAGLREHHLYLPGVDKNPAPR
jgi:trk system potassium uptake protein TrkH